MFANDKIDIIGQRKGMERKEKGNKWKGRLREGRQRQKKSKKIKRDERTKRKEKKKGKKGKTRYKNRKKK